MTKTISFLDGRSPPNNGDLSWLAKHQSSALQKFYPTGRGFEKNVGGNWWGDPERGYKRVFEHAVVLRWTLLGRVEN